MLIFFCLPLIFISRLLLSSCYGMSFMVQSVLLFFQKRLFVNVISTLDKIMALITSYGQ